MQKGDYGNVLWEFNPNGWVGILFTRDIFDGTLGLADAHLTIFWRSLKLSRMTTGITTIARNGGGAHLDLLSATYIAKAKFIR